MQKLLSVLLLSGLALLTANCSLTGEKIESCPGSCTTVTGRLLTSGQQGLGGATVTAVWKNGQPFLSGQIRTKARTTTDVNGNYQLSFFVKDDELQDGYFDVSVSVDKNRYYVLDSEVAAFSDIKRDTAYQLAPYLIPRQATANLTVPNANQVQSYFSVEFVSAYGNSLTSTKNSLGGGTVIGVPMQATPFTYSTPVAADQKLYLRTTKTTNGTYVRTLDSLVVGAGTTRNITVTY